MRICKKSDTCKRKIHYYKPEFSSVFTHKIIKTKSGDKWIPLPKPIIKIDTTKKGWFNSLPLDFEHYKIIDKKTGKELFTH